MNGEMAETEATGYSVYIVPTKTVYKGFDKVMNELVRRYSDNSLKYQAPRFEPHLTLIGDLVGSEDEVIVKCDKLASSLTPFDISLNALGQSEKYFKCVFIKAEKTKELVDANAKAREIFGRSSDPEYMPHISLIYGIFNEKIRREIIDSVKQADNEILSYMFKAGAISLYSTEGPAEMWHKIRDFKLTS